MLWWLMFVHDPGMIHNGRQIASRSVDGQIQRNGIVIFPKRGRAAGAGAGRAPTTTGSKTVDGLTDISHGTNEMMRLKDSKRQFA